MELTILCNLLMHLLASNNENEIMHLLEKKISKTGIPCKECDFYKLPFNVHVHMHVHVWSRENR